VADYQVTRDVAQKTATEDMLRAFVVCLDRLQRTPSNSGYPKLWNPKHEQVLPDK
jgi:hypothetical protein